MKYFFLLPVFFLLHANAQVVNIESLRFLNDSDGWEGTIKFNLAAEQNVNTIYNFGNAIHAQYKKGRSRCIFINDFSLSNTNGHDFENSGFQHLRYNYKLKNHERVTWEAFIQSQYNKPMKIDFRGLIGTGPRYRMIKTDKVHMYIAALYMFEHEEDEGEMLEKIYNDHRLDAYLSFTWAPEKNAEMINTFYYQPAFADFNDYRVSESFSFAFAINKHFSFETVFGLTYDTKQPPGIPNLYWSFAQGLNYNFK
jgi:hypothetical protein